MTGGRLAAALLAASIACAGASAAGPGGKGGGASGARAEVGIASFYADRFHGRRTASGELHDRDAFTSAHPRARFGTRLRVTDLATGRSVVVRVNDRGPFVKGRIVDLSLAAARALGIVERGLARVRVEPLREAAPGSAR